MIVCHCNVITDREIEAVIEDLLAEKPYRLLTPGLLYKALGKSGRCCGCFPNVSALIARANERVAARDEVAAERLHRQQAEHARESDFSRFVHHVPARRHA